MTKRMLIDATHAEETRVVVLDGNRLEDFDVETSTKKQLKGNIYLAKVVRVEPSLQAAFVDYGGNRHGFLAFDEIHPDYYQIPVADRERLLAQQVEQAQREQEEEDRAAEAAAIAAEAPASADAGPAVADDEPSTPVPLDVHSPDQDAQVDQPSDPAPEPPLSQDWPPIAEAPDAPPTTAMPLSFAADEIGAAEPPPPAAEAGAEPAFSPAPPPFAATESADESGATTAVLVEATAEEDVIEARPADSAEDQLEEPDDHPLESPPPEIIGGEHDTGEDSRERRIPPRFLRNYKIQEVIRRRQILLVQVVKEERGTKGAALTTYISLAGRYGVLMPNSPRGGGISRKITAAADRARLKEVMAELDLPPGMGLIVRTAGANRPKAEIKRDCEYLLRLWDDIRDHTMRSVAPALIYEEASLIKRAIRDVYSRDIDEISVDGDEGWRAARDFMRMLMPSHVRKVQLWRESASGNGQPLFARYQVDAQLDAILSPTVQLRSGGYLVINQAEALVAIDVNSGRSTRERGIEETALRTNLEAADEVARQLRLRDLAGLIVIDFIDMESRKHNGMVERRLKEALKADRARIQLGHISHFGLLEMSRQRLRPSLAETSFVLCPHCGGTGHVRSIESAAIHVLRGIEEEGAKRRAAEIIVHCAADAAMYILNHKRDRLSGIEARTGMHVMFGPDGSLPSPQFRIERLRAQSPSEAPPAITAEAGRAPADGETEQHEPASAIGADDDSADGADEELEGLTADSAEGGTEDEGDRRPRRRRRRRRGRRDEVATASSAGESATPEVEESATAEPVEGAEIPVEGVPEHAASLGSRGAPSAEIPVEGVPEHAEPPPADAEAPNRRRGRRVSRRRRRETENGLSPVAEPGADQPDLPPVYVGPTPADPFGGRAFDIFDVLEQAEERAAAPAEAMPAPALPTVTGEDPVPEPSPEVTHEPAMAPVPDEPQAVAELVIDPPQAANDQSPEPVIKPIVIGTEDAPPVERKRGWWRR